MGVPRVQDRGSRVHTTADASRTPIILSTEDPALIVSFFRNPSGVGAYEQGKRAGDLAPVTCASKKRADGW